MYRFFTGISWDFGFAHRPGHAVLMRAGVACHCPDTNCRLGARATGGWDEGNTFRRDGKAMGAQRMYAPTILL